MRITDRTLSPVLFPHTGHLSHTIRAIHEQSVFTLTPSSLATWPQVLLPAPSYMPLP